VIAGAQQLATEEVVGTSGRPVELLLAGSGCQDGVAADLAGDRLLTAMVRPENFSASKYIELLI
jgi:hypothetical protein